MKRAVRALACLAPVVQLLGAESAPTRTAGKYEVSLRLPADGLFAQEESEIEFHVADESQQDPLSGAVPVVRAVIDVSIDMQSMPGMPGFQETAHAESVPGDYGVHPTFAHGGEYLMRVSVKPPQDAPFQVDFPLEIRDAAGRDHKAHAGRFRLDLVSTPKSPKSGAPAELQLTVRERDKPKDAYTTFERTHEELMHLIIVRDDLTQFAHEHPVLGSDGVFRLSYVFRVGGEYHLFADVAPKSAGSQILMAKLKVSGSARATTAREVDRSDGSRVELKSDGAQFPIGKTTRVVFSMQPADGLEPYLGARAHLIAIYQDAITFVHAHADESQPFDGKFEFLARFPQSGSYRAWVQFKRNGQVTTREFTLEAKGN